LNKSWATNYLNMQSKMAAKLFLASRGSEGERQRWTTCDDVLLFLAGRGGAVRLPLHLAGGSGLLWWGQPIGMRRYSAVSPCSGRLGVEQAHETPNSAAIWEGAQASSLMRTPMLQLGAQHMETKFVAMICGQEEGHHCRCVDSGYSTSMAEAF
jgi:hypothetical protein